MSIINTHDGRFSFGDQVLTSLILSDPSCKDGNARFTTVPVKTLTAIKYKLDIFISPFEYRVTHKEWDCKDDPKL